jgi:hypothetical protein
MDSRLTVLILGGYGAFGGRLVRLLAPDGRLTLIVAGRSAERARQFCEGLGGGAKTVPLALDRDGDFAAALDRLRPDILVDASGPFQAYGKAPYRVVEACIDRGIAYLDLADGSDFVEGIGRLDDAARAKGVFALSGTSTCPALTAAVLRELADGMERIDSVAGGIAPSPFVGLGLGVIQAIASYAGKPVSVLRDGVMARAYPFTETRRVTVAPPGRIPLASRLFSLIDVPDHRVLPKLFPGLRTVWFGAGPVPPILHRGMVGLAWLVRLRILPSLAPLAPLFHRTSGLFRWGEHRSGMFVRVSGSDAKGALTREWHVVAEGDEGPSIPAMAAAAVIRRCLDGKRPESGARSAVHDVDLSDYESFFAGRAIHTGRREERAGNALPLYRRILGDAYEELPPAIRILHDIDGSLRAAGRASIERGRSPLARLGAMIIGFPPAGDDVPVEVRFLVAKGRETWRRTFAGKSFESLQEEGTGRSARLLIERFGPLGFAMAVVVTKDGLELVLRRWTVFGLPLPLWLAPRMKAFEREEDGRFRFHVEIGHPLTGPIVRYRGWLEPVAGP